jgi:hydroxymethylpyrimidine pyrophosphatase-like HAD family hydrolase
MIKHIAIYDMDGTIVDSTHRYRVNSENKIDLQYWRDNQHKAMGDSLLPLAIQYKKDLNDPETYVIIATARVLNKPDMQFIDEILGKPDHIISRKSNDDTRSGKTLKIGGLTKFFNLVNFKNAVAVFYEDNVEYLKAVCDRFTITGVYIPSNQGH